MNKQEEYKNDLLRQYMNPDSVETAPEGFTSNIMTRIGLEKLPATKSEGFFKRNAVPVISGAVFLVLLVAAFLLTGKEVDSTVLPLLNFLRKIELSLPQVNLSSTFRISLPSVLMYVSVGMCLLLFFDRALYRIFHREK
jgi:hypothetical protein